MTTARAVWDALGTVIDPEYPLSLVDLGMVYGVHVEDRTAHIDLTFTTIGCPAIDMILEDVETAVRAVDAVDDVEVHIVWSPPWTKERITERGRRVLKLYGVVS